MADAIVIKISKRKVFKMIKDYEITFISKVESDPGVEKTITELGGTIASLKELGRKSLAYAIQKETAGYYFVVRFSLDSESQAELNKKLSHTDGLLRFLIVNLPTARIAKQAEIMDKVAKIRASKEVEAQPSLAKEERTKMVDEQLDKLLGKEEANN